MKRLIAIVLICAGLSACTTSTTIKSIPPGARAYIDQRLLGETPVKFSDSSAFWTKRRLVLKMDGWEDTEFILRKNELRVGPLIGTILIAVPVFWLFGYPNELTYELEPEPRIPEVEPTPPSS